VLLRRSTCLATYAFIFFNFFLCFFLGGMLGGVRAAASAREEALLPCYFCIFFFAFYWFYFCVFFEGFVWKRSPAEVLLHCCWCFYLLIYFLCWEVLYMHA
jgi:hypothetical protein